VKDYLSQLPKEALSRREFLEEDLASVIQSS
jgi:hypothetical protein